MSRGGLEVPFGGAYWVEPGKLLAGGYPGAFQADTAMLRMEALLLCGIRCIVNLTQEFEGGGERRYEGMLASLAGARGLEARVLSFPIRDMDVPSTERMIRILDAMDDSIDRGDPVYVHCLAGLGRTGTVVGCWLVRHARATGRTVLDEIAALRGDANGAYWSSPVTDGQCDFVRRWQQGR